MKMAEDGRRRLLLSADISLLE